MERVSDEWLAWAVDNFNGRCGVGSAKWALKELQERRRAEKEQGNTNPTADTKMVDDEILDALIAGEGNAIAGSWNAIMYALCELKAYRKAEAEKAVLPIPCTKGFEHWTVKQFFAKINEELDEMKEVVFDRTASSAGDCKSLLLEKHGTEVAVAEEAADVITAITSFLESMGIDEGMRQEAQEVVNAKNLDRGRL